MRLTTAPQTYYSDHYDITRFKLTWNLSLVISLMLILVSIINISNANYTSLTNFLGAGIGTVGLIIMYQTRKYELVCKLITISIFVLVTTAFFTITRALHYTTPMWGMLNVLFAFFMLGKYWGSGVLIGHFIVIILYYIFRIEGNISNLPPFDESMIINFSIETVIVAAANLYLLSQFMTSMDRAEKSARDTNRALRGQNEIISNQKKEIEVMLKEIHHRVKNNLQIITSLLRLQAMDLEGDENKEFEEAITRVKSMALIHEKMYQNDILANFNLENYLESLLEEIVSTYNIKKQIRLNVFSELTSIGNNSIVPLSLLFNELISNSIKHGLKHKERPIIKVQVTEEQDGYFQIIYSDNGVWIDNDKKTFGMELIDSMTNQLEGEYYIEKDTKGTSFFFNLKVLND